MLLTFEPTLHDVPADATPVHLMHRYFDGAAWFPTRFFTSALTEHEQRLLVIAHLDLHPPSRRAVAKTLTPGAPHDQAAMAQYEAALERGEEPEQARAAALGEAREILPQVDALLDTFTLEDLYTSGPVTRQMISWSAAELLLERAQRPELAPTLRHVSLYLALAIIDSVELRAAAGLTPRYPRVVRDLWQRIGAALERSSTAGRPADS